MWIASLGAALGTIAFIGAPTDLVGQVLPGALATVTLLALGVSTITSSCLDCYSGALAWLIAGVRMSRRQAVLVNHPALGACAAAVAFLAAGLVHYALTRRPRAKAATRSSTDTHQEIPV
ncbi:hypothetical protein [Streptomyces sp. NPDC046887]|uniref:hypothetical protein n=1 Tax=Streptomyces sp. NPDC046887 TaxID=3155472 RepID=UPI0033D595B6